jgi:hypothetical protein
MKITILLFLFFLAACCFNACDTCGSGSTDTFSIDQKGHVFMIPFYPDSLSGDSLEMSVFFYFQEGVKKQVVYSSTLDSFRITADIAGWSLSKTEADNWKPSYSYNWVDKRLRVHYNDFHPYIIEQKNSQTPQCTPAENSAVVTSVKIEVPRTVKSVYISPY